MPWRNSNKQYPWFVSGVLNHRGAQRTHRCGCQISSVFPPSHYKWKAHTDERVQCFRLKVKENTNLLFHLISSENTPSALARRYNKGINLSYRRQNVGFIHTIFIFSIGVYICKLMSVYILYLHLIYLVLQMNIYKLQL